MTAVYREGIEARDLNQTKNANPYPAITEQWAWWMAGWNDRDMESK